MRQFGADEFIVQVPPALIAQLKRGGRLVIPLGQPGETQMLMLLEKDATGKVPA